MYTVSGNPEAMYWATGEHAAALHTVLRAHWLFFFSFKQLLRWLFSILFSICSGIIYNMILNILHDSKQQSTGPQVQLSWLQTAKHGTSGPALMTKQQSTGPEVQLSVFSSRPVFPLLQPPQLEPLTAVLFPTALVWWVPEAQPSCLLHFETWLS